jgi:hypothetical protein
MLPLAVVPLLGSLLSVSKVAAFAMPQGGGGVKFPLPTGLPTLWTFTSTSGTGGGVTVGPPGLSSVVGLGLFVVGFFVTAALEAGFLGRLAGVAAGRNGAFVDAAIEYLGRIVVVKVVLAVVTFAVAIPLFFFPPLAVALALVVGYLLYGAPFVIVVEDLGVVAAIRRSVSLALSGGPYFAYATGYLAVGTVGSFVLTAVVFNLGLVGVVVGAGLVSVPALFLTAVGVVTFRNLAGQKGQTPA